MGAGIPLAGWEAILVSEVGLQAEVPRGWVRDGAEWVWSPDGSPAVRLGVRWHAAEAGWRDAEMLPDGAVVLQSVTDPAALDWRLIPG